jgi:hypothetical protein
MIFREGCLNLLVGPQNVGKTSLILRGLAAGGLTHGLILCGTDYSRIRCAHAVTIPIGDDFDDLETTDISDGGVVVINYCMTYDVDQWSRIAERFKDWRQRRITVIVAVTWMWWLPQPLLAELFGEARIFVFRTPMAHNRRRLFELFGRYRFPTQADFNAYMDEMGQAPLWHGAFDVSVSVGDTAKGDGV